MNDEMTERAVKAYLRRCKRQGVSAEQPSNAATYRDGDTVIVGNSHRELARFKVRTIDGKEVVRAA